MTAPTSWTRVDLARESRQALVLHRQRRLETALEDYVHVATDADDAAIVASTALIATQRVSTARRHEGKRSQERAIEDALLNANFGKVPTRSISTLDRAPEEGQFCGESLLGNRKADFVVRLWDRRVLALECKVSNSSTNSVKRLNNDAAAKAEAWRRDFGERQVVPAAVLSGVYKIHNLIDAQERGLAVFWAHDLAQLLAWIEKTRPDGRRTR